MSRRFGYGLRLGRGNLPELEVLQIPSEGPSLTFLLALLGLHFMEVCYVWMRSLMCMIPHMAKYVENILVCAYKFRDEYLAWNLHKDLFCMLSLYIYMLEIVGIGLCVWLCVVAGVGNVGLSWGSLIRLYDPPEWQHHDKARPELRNAEVGY